jgi:hypothetical protein
MPSPPSISDLTHRGNAALSLKGGLRRSPGERQPLVHRIEVMGDAEGGKASRQTR